MALFTPSFLRRILFLLVGLGSALASAAQTPSSWTWARGLHGPGDDAFNDIARDAAGSTYAVGYFEQMATVGGLSLTSRGEADAVVVKYDPTGVPVWVRHFGGTKYDRADQVAVDAQGNVYVAGLFEGMATFGSITLTPRSPGTGFFVVKLDAQGIVQWGQMADSGNFTASYGLQPDGAGGAYVAGVFTNGVRMGNLSLPADIGGAILARLDAQGNVLWARQQATRILFTTGFNQLVGYGLAVGGGYVYATGNFGGTVEFRGTTLQAPDNNDTWLASYDADGNLRWIRQGGNPTKYDVAHAVVADASGQVYISGQFEGAAMFGGLSLSATGTASDAFLVKYDAQGNALWARQFGGAGREIGYSLALDAQSNIYQAGSYSIGAQAGSVALPNQGGLDAYVASYTGQGVLRWVHSAGGPGDDQPLAVTAPDATGSLCLAGAFNGATTTFGTTTLANQGPFEPYIYDGFLARLGGVVTSSGSGQSSTSLTLSPNPATYEVCLTNLLAGSKVQLLDVAGRLLREVTATAALTLSVRDLTSGLYLIRTTNKQGQPCTGRLLVR